MLAAALVLALTVAAPLPAPPPAYPDGTRDLPKVSAETWIVYDATADEVLARWNADERRPMASVTKVMTAIVVLEHAEITDEVVVPEFATRTRGSTAGLVAGERRTVEDLLVAMLVRSGNDAALTLAYAVGDGSVDRFVDLMNRKARELGMADTRFVNPNGLDAEGHYSTARDLLTLMKAAVGYPQLMRVAGIRTVKLPADPNGTVRRVRNTNRLLGVYPGVVGLKTGDTPWAGKVLLAVAQRGPRTLMTVVMGSEDHFADTRELLDWGFATYGLGDRVLRPFYAEQGGGAVTDVPPDVPERQARRLAALPRLDDGRWRRTPVADLPKGHLVGRWVRDVFGDLLGSSG